MYSGAYDSITRTLGALLGILEDDHVGTSDRLRAAEIIRLIHDENEIDDREPTTCSVTWGTIDPGGEIPTSGFASSAGEAGE